MITNLLRQAFRSFANNSKTKIVPGRHLTVFSSKEYDEKYFEQINSALPASQQYSFEYIESNYNEKTCKLIPNESNTIICFVNDKLNAAGLQKLKKSTNVDLIALRCAGFNNVDLAEA